MLLLVLLAGCASSGFDVRPEQIPALERDLARAPDDAGTATRLGVAYYTADRFDDARRTLAAAIENGATRGAAWLYLGLANEELEDWAAARAAYDAYLARSTQGRVQGEVRNRLALVTRKELREDARRALQRENVLSDQPPTPNSVAVLPFRISGLPDELKPLQTALADMIITDLGMTGLRSVERVRVQSMIDEMVLAQAGFTAGESGARMGRLLRAAHVVQGILSGTGSEVALDASVLDTEPQTTRQELNRSGGLDAIFELEKQIVFDILAALEIVPTASEREAITSNRTGNLIAFLAYGRGLEALDRGDYTAAMAEFEQAGQLDPGFGAVRAQQVEAEQLNTAAASAPEQVGAAALIEVAPVPTATMAVEIANEVNYSPAVAVTTEKTAPSTTTPAASGGGAGDGSGGAGGGSAGTGGNAGQGRSPAGEQKKEPPASSATSTVITIIIPIPGGGI